MQGLCTYKECTETVQWTATQFIPQDKLARSSEGLGHYLQYVAVQDAAHSHLQRWRPTAYLHVPVCPWMDIQNLTQEHTGLVHSPMLAPAHMAKQWCNHQAWLRDMMEFYVFLSKCVTQKILRDDEKKNSPDVLQVKSQISLSIISYWLVTVRRSKYMFVFFDFHYPYWNTYMNSNQLGVNINRE